MTKHIVLNRGQSGRGAVEVPGNWVSINLKYKQMRLSNDLVNKSPWLRRGKFIGYEYDDDKLTVKVFSHKEGFRVGVNKRKGAESGPHIVRFPLNDLTLPKGKRFYVKVFKRSFVINCGDET